MSSAIDLWLGLLAEACIGLYCLHGLPPSLLRQLGRKPRVEEILILFCALLGVLP